MTPRRIALAAVLALGACTNPETPAGYEGYIYHVPLLFGKMERRGTLRGPASTGVSWRLYVANIDSRARSYAENFQLLTSDNLRISFEVNARLQLRRDSVVEVVEGWGGAEWYEQQVRERLRTMVRRRVMEVSATEIQLQTDAVRQRIFDDLVAQYAETPVEILSVDIGHIEYPAEVMTAIQNKIAKQQELQRQDYILAKMRKEAAIRVLEALKVAKQQQIISSTLDPLYVQRKAVQVYRSLAGASNETIVMLPNSPEGTGLPLVTSRGRRKELSPGDESFLREMEKRYMKVANEAPLPLEEGAAAPREAAPSAPIPNGEPGTSLPASGAPDAKTAAPVPEGAPGAPGAKTGLPEAGGKAAAPGSPDAETSPPVASGKTAAPVAPKPRAAPDAEVGAPDRVRSGKSAP